MKIALFLSLQERSSGEKRNYFREYWWLCDIESSSNVDHLKNPETFLRSCITEEWAARLKHMKMGQT